MSCGKYRVKHMVYQSDRISEITEITLGYSGSFPSKGCKYVYKYPEEKELETCIMIDGKHYDMILNSSSDLYADDSKGEYFYASQGPLKIPAFIAKQLKVSIGDKVVIRDVTLPKAVSIELQPLLQLQPSLELPKIVYPGMEIICSPKVTEHEIYGGVFSRYGCWKITSITGPTSKIPYKYSSSSTKLSFLPASYRVIPKNLYKVVSHKGLTSQLSELKRLIQIITSYIDQRCIFSIDSLRGCGKRAAVIKAGWKVGITVSEVSMFNFIQLKDFEELLNSQPPKSILHVRQFNEAISLISSNNQENSLKLRDLLLTYTSQATPGLLFLSSSSSSSASPTIRNLCIPLSLSAPSSDDRSLILRSFSQPVTPQVLMALSGKTIEEIIYICKGLKAGISIDDLLKEFRSTGSGIPNVKWEDVGGLIDAKQDIIDTIQLPLMHPEHFKMKSRSGLLLYGPPGTGKTLLAKAIATECALNFLPVKGPELLNMYVGESEKNVRELFERARAISPCVLFFDELDSLAPKRGQNSDSGVMDRIVAQLLTEIDGLTAGSKLFVIGATNRPDLLDQALLRPGRFDKMIYLGIAQDKLSKVKIFEAVTRKFKLKDVDFDEIAQKCQGSYSGADIYAVCAQAVGEAYKEKVGEMEEKVRRWNDEMFYEEAMTFDNAVVNWPEIAEVNVEQRHFLAAASEIKPSISEKDMLGYKSFSN